MEDTPPSLSTGGQSRVLVVYVIVLDTSKLKHEDSFSSSFED